MFFYLLVRRIIGTNASFPFRTTQIVNYTKNIDINAVFISKPIPICSNSPKNTCCHWLELLYWALLPCLLLIQCFCSLASFQAKENEETQQTQQAHPKQNILRNWHTTHIDNVIPYIQHPYSTLYAYIFI